jgi:lysophospholipase L1-like esterase
MRVGVGNRKSKLLVFVHALSLLSVLMLSSIARLLVKTQIMSKTSSGVVHAMSSTTASKHRIFCFGDSLTAGTCPPDFQEYPYAPHLEAKLENVMVRHVGFPGWTSDQLLEDANGASGLRTIIRRNKDTPLSAVVLLAGTNDLGFERPVQDIVDSIVALHRLCYDENVAHTVAIGVPPSAYQSVNKEATQYAQQVNEGLKGFCNSESRATFVPFPFGWAQGDERWASDGLHFSPSGYKELGESLAPFVQMTLSGA